MKKSFLMESVEIVEYPSGSMKKILHPPIRSYVLRQGRMTPAQKHAMDEYWCEFGLKFTTSEIDLTGVFAREAPVVLEVGFGNGESLLKQCVDFPEKNFIGIEVHSPGVGRLIAEAKSSAVKNLRVFQHDAVEVLSACMPNESLDAVQIFFPDPWPKKRHHKRRLVQSEFVELVLSKLKPGGTIHCATDWENYAEHMLCILSATEGLENFAGAGDYFAHASRLRPLTKFEQRGLRLNHSIHDLVFSKVAV